MGKITNYETKDILNAIELAQEEGYDYDLLAIVEKMWASKARKEIGVYPVAIFEKIRGRDHLHNFEGYKAAIVAKYESDTGLPLKKLLALTPYARYAGGVWLSELTAKTISVTFSYNLYRDEFHKLFPSATSYQNGKTKIKGEDYNKAKDWLIRVFLAYKYLGGYYSSSGWVLRSIDLEEEAQALLDTL